MIPAAAMAPGAGPDRSAPFGNVKATRGDWLAGALSVLAIEGVGRVTVLEPERPARRVALELLLVFQEPGRAVRRASGALGGAQHARDRNPSRGRRRPRSTRLSAMSSAAGSIPRSSARVSISRSASGRDARRKSAGRSTVPTATGPTRSGRCSNASAIATRTLWCGRACSTIRRSAITRSTSGSRWRLG